jgi:hypothetical protein
MRGGGFIVVLRDEINLKIIHKAPPGNKRETGSLEISWRSPAIKNTGLTATHKDLFANSSVLLLPTG